MTNPQNTPIVCGHRGAPAITPENTMASFQTAMDRGATWVEFDVRPSGDGRLVIHHDPDTADGSHIASTTYSDLDDTIPVFGDLASGLPELGLDIEMKTDAIAMSLGAFAELVIDEIDEHCPSIDNLVVTSFDAAALVEVRTRRPDVPTGLLFWDKAADWAIKTAVEDGHGAIAPWIKLLTADVVDQARQAGLEVVTWTVNEPDQVRHAAALGVDMIIGDDPTVILDNV